jgi:hypothetical protein
MSAAEESALAKSRREWLEDHGCAEDEVQLGEAGEFVMVEVEHGLKKVHLPEALQAGYDPEAALDGEVDLGDDVVGEDD